jgi:hypothetical protein
VLAIGLPSASKALDQSSSPSRLPRDDLQRLRAINYFASVERDWNAPLN